MSGDAIGDGVCELACEVVGCELDGVRGLFEGGDFGGHGGIEIEVLEFEVRDLSFEGLEDVSGVRVIEFGADERGDGVKVMEVFEGLLEDSELSGSGDGRFGFENGGLDECWGEVIGVLVRFCESAPVCGVCERFDGDEFAEDGGPLCGKFEVIEPWVAGLWESGEEDGGDGIFEHAFVEAIGKFLKASGAVDGEWDA